MKDVVILEDHKMFAMTFSLFLEETGQFQSVRNFDNPSALLNHLRTIQPNELYVFLDYFVPDAQIENVIKKIKDIFISSKIIVLTSLESPILLNQLLALNICGIVSKIDSVQEVMLCIKNYEKGKMYLSTTIQQIFSKSRSNQQKIDLTKKELEILQLLAKGKSVTDIADELSISKHTIVTHRRNILTKSDFNSIADLIIYMIKNKLI
jgi:DNA-binding NarL/FixJ family response regulator